MPELSEAYVIGLLTDLEIEVPKLATELNEARARAERVSAELVNLIRRMDESKSGLAAAKKAAEDAATAISEKNNRTASLHQEIAAITKRSEDLKTEMERVGPGAIYNRLRRDRARLTVQVEDRQKEIEKLKSDVEQARAALVRSETQTVEQKDRSRAIMSELDRLQGELPRPELYVHMFEATAARAHCRLHLDRDPEAWEKELRAAIALMMELHRELRAGKYRIDRNSDVIGCRAAASAEALFGAVALGDKPLALELFGLAADPSLLFDHIFNVFRSWCLGLFLGGRIEDLRSLLAQHRFSLGLRGGYVQAFYGLIDKDAKKLAAGLKQIARHEWEVWQDPKLVRGAGMVNLGAAAITRLALEGNLRVDLPGPTVPDVIIAGKRRLAAGRRA